MRRLTYEFVKEQFEKESYTLLSKDYKNNQQKLKCVCPKGHTNDISFANWSNRNSRCPYCYGNIKKTLEEVLMLFEKAGYTLLTRKYENNKQKLACVCQNGHRYSTTLSNWLQGKRCPYCCGQIKPTIKFIRAAFKKEGYILLTNKYINNLQKLNFICSNGHRYKISWANWKKGHRCRICFFMHNIGSSHYNWKGGISCEPYCDVWLDKEFKESIKARDNYKCQNPHCWGTSNRLCIHHIDYNKKNCSPTNLITLCISCNSRANKDRVEHKKFYNKLIKEIYTIKEV